MSISGRALLLALVGGLLLAGTAFAHADYLRSMPGENSVVSSPPERVEIWFTQELFRRQDENQIMVFDPEDRPVHAGEAQVDDDDRTHLWVELLPDLAPGTYRVEWRSLSAEDGDNDEGEFSFTFDPQAETTSTPMGAEALGVPTAEPGAAPPATSPGTPLQEQPVPTTPTASIATQAPTGTHTPQAAQTGPEAQGTRCLPGSIPVAGLVGTAWILRRRRPVSL